MKTNRIALLAIAAAFLVACEGAEGPTGPAGSKGDPGIPGIQGPAGQDGQGYTFWTTTVTATGGFTFVPLPAASGTLNDLPSIQVWVRMASGSWFPMYDGWSSRDDSWLVQADPNGGIRLLIISSAGSVYKIDLAY